MTDDRYEALAARLDQLGTDLEAGAYGQASIEWVLQLHAVLLGAMQGREVQIDALTQRLRDVVVKMQTLHQRMELLETLYRTQPWRDA